MKKQGGSIQTTSHMRHWAVLVACCLLVGCGFTIPMLSFGVFLSPLVSYFDCSVTEVSIYFTFTAATAVFSSALGERVLRKSMRATVVVCSCAMALAFVALAAFPAVPMVWAAGVVAGLSFPLCSTVLVPIAINNWFVVRQGTFIGIAFAMVGVFGMFFSPFFTALIGAFGWRLALVVSAIVLVVVNCLVAAFLLRQHPSLIGMQAYGAEAGVDRLSATDSSEVTSEQVGKVVDKVAGRNVFAVAEDGSVQAADTVSLHAQQPSETGVRPNPAPVKVLRTKTFWLCALAALLGGIFGDFNSQLNTVAQSSGFDPVTAGLALSTASAGLMVGKIVMGWLKDLKGSLFAIVFGCTMGIAAFAITSVGITSGNVKLLYFGAFIAGFCTCLATLSAAFLSSAAFEPGAYARAVSYLTAFCNLGMAVGIPFYSLSFDMLGSYLPILITCAILPIVCALVAAVGIRMGASKQLV